MEFDMKYTEYWKLAVNKSIDGTTIPGLRHAEKFLSEIQFSQSSPTIVDVGCSFGRMFPLLSGISKTVHGLDVDPFALNSAANFTYSSLRIASAENTNFEDCFADLVFA